MIKAQDCLSYVILCLYLWLGAAHIASMGDLFVHIQESIKDLVSDKNRITKCSLDNKICLVHAASFCFVVIAAIICSYEIHEVIDGDFFHSTDQRNIYSFPQAMKRKLGHFTAYVQFPIAVILLIIYVMLWRLLKTHFSTSLKSELCTIHLLCLVFLVTYTFRAIFSIFLGTYRYDIVCQAEIRYLIYLLIDFICNFLPIVTVLYFHHQSFREDKKVVSRSRQRT